VNAINPSATNTPAAATVNRFLKCIDDLLLARTTARGRHEVVENRPQDGQALMKMRARPVSCNFRELTSTVCPHQIVANSCKPFRDRHLERTFPAN
jgi:hypothetical protein